MTWINPIQSTFWKRKFYLKTCFCNFFRSQNIKEDSIITGVFYPFNFFFQHNQAYMKMLFLTQFKLIQSTFNLWLLFNSSMSSPFLFCFMCILELLLDMAIRYSPSPFCSFWKFYQIIVLPLQRTVVFSLLFKEILLLFPLLLSHYF